MTRKLKHSYGQVDFDYAARSSALAPEDDGTVWMGNLMAYKKKAVYDGVEAEIDGKEADNKYNPIDVLTKIGADMCFVSDVVDQGEGSEPRWDRIAVVQYATRRSFIEMSARKDFQEKHKHKEAGMAQTIVCPSLPITEVMEELDAITPAAPANDQGDETIISLHTVRFKADAAEQQSDYPLAIGKVALAHGGTIEAILEVEGTVLGDGRSWDQTFMFRFPSLAAYKAAYAEMTSGALGEPVADRYDVATRPMIDRMRASLDDKTA